MEQARRFRTQRRRPVDRRAAKAQSKGGSAPLTWKPFVEGSLYGLGLIRAHGAVREVDRELISYFFSPSAGGLKADDMKSRIVSNQKGRGPDNHLPFPKSKEAPSSKQATAPVASLNPFDAARLFP